MSIYQIALAIGGAVGLVGALVVWVQGAVKADVKRREAEQLAFREAALWLAREMEKNNELRRLQRGKE